MRAKCLPVRKQRVRLNQDIGGVLKEGITGWVTLNKGLKQAKNTAGIPDYIFRPDANPELSFLVFSQEVELIVDSAK